MSPWNYLGQSPLKSGRVFLLEKAHAHIHVLVFCVWLGAVRQQNLNLGNKMCDTRSTLNGCYSLCVPPRLNENVPEAECSNCLPSCAHNQIQPESGIGIERTSYELCVTCAGHSALRGLCVMEL